MGTMDVIEVVSHHDILNVIDGVYDLQFVSVLKPSYSSALSLFVLLLLEYIISYSFHHEHVDGCCLLQNDFDFRFQQ